LIQATNITLEKQLVLPLKTQRIRGRIKK